MSTRPSYSGAPEHHGAVDAAAPHPDPGDGDPQPDAQPRRQHRYQHPSCHLGPEYPGGSFALSRRPATEQSARASALFQNHHAREARLRSLIAVATTPAVKARLTEQAEESERLAYGFAED